MVVVVERNEPVSLELELFSARSRVNPESSLADRVEKLLRSFNRRFERPSNMDTVLKVSTVAKSAYLKI